MVEDTRVAGKNGNPRQSFPEKRKGESLWKDRGIGERFKCCNAPPFFPNSCSSPGFRKDLFVFDRTLCIQYRGKGKRVKTADYERCSGVSHGIRLTENFFAPKTVATASVCGLQGFSRVGTKHTRKGGKCVLWEGENFRVCSLPGANVLK